MSNGSGIIDTPGVLLYPLPKNTEVPHATYNAIERENSTLMLKEIIDIEHSKQ